MSKTGKNGVTSDTAKNIPFGAGTIHKGLKCTEGVWNFANSLVGATSGGSHLVIAPEYTDINIDGVHVQVKGLTKKKTGETATLEVNWAELSADIIKDAINGAVNTDDAVTGYTLLESKPDIVEGDYWDNIAFVGKTLDGRNIIVILDNALCTNGLDLQGQDKTQGVLTTTHECSAELSDDGEVDYDTLPYHIYYPTAAAQTNN